MARKLILVAYDISDDKMLRRVRREVAAYAVGGQKSIYECWLKPCEIAPLQQRLTDLYDMTKDRIHFFELDPADAPLYVGTARRQSITPFLVL